MSASVFFLLKRRYKVVPITLQVEFFLFCQIDTFSVWADRIVTPDTIPLGILLLERGPNAIRHLWDPVLERSVLIGNSHRDALFLPFCQLGSYLFLIMATLRKTSAFSRAWDCRFLGANCWKTFNRLIYGVCNLFPIVLTGKTFLI